MPKYEGSFTHGRFEVRCGLFEGEETVRVCLRSLAAPLGYKHHRSLNRVLRREGEREALDVRQHTHDYWLSREALVRLLQLAPVDTADALTREFDRAAERLFREAKLHAMAAETKVALPEAAPSSSEAPVSASPVSAPLFPALPPIPSDAAVRLAQARYLSEYAGALRAAKKLTPEYRVYLARCAAELALGHALPMPEMPRQDDPAPKVPASLGAVVESLKKPVPAVSDPFTFGAEATSIRRDPEFGEWNLSADPIAFVEAKLRPRTQSQSATRLAALIGFRCTPRQVGEAANALGLKDTAEVEAVRVPKSDSSGELVDSYRYKPSACQKIAAYVLRHPTATMRQALYDANYKLPS